MASTSCATVSLVACQQTCASTIVYIEAVLKQRNTSRHQKLCNDVLLQKLRKETLRFALISFDAEDTSGSTPNST